jgi:hypothetical protein
MQVRKTIGVRLYADEFEALRTVAEREDRDPRRQAARLIRESLIRGGALTLSDQSDPANGPDPKTAA